MILLLSLLAWWSPAWDTDPDAWGIGMLTAQELFEDGGAFYPYELPLELGLPYYDRPGPRAALQGFLTHRVVQPERTASGSRLWDYPLQTERRNVHSKDLRETGYEVSSLLVFERQDQWVRVLQHSHDGGVWMNLENLRQAAVRYLSWMDFMTENDNPYHPPEAFGLNLRSGPGAGFERLVTMKGDHFVIRLTGKTDQTYWAEAKVTEFNIHPCEGGEPTGREWTGWLKLLDDAGFPNIWYYTRGC